ncbi:MAG TPA: hypothetical protein PKB02_01755 [Anaerohalosphaeraceae bacterium]|nr:hypothetical protein [Anaerohalosphaeraceae bacterium]
MSKNCLQLMVVGILVFVVSGCAANRVSLMDTNQVTVAKQDSEKIRILWTDVYQTDGQTWAYGALKQRGYHPSSIKAHVDIQVLSEDGSVQYETFSDDVYVPRNRPGKGPDWRRFKVQLAENIPTEAVVAMKVHSGKHKDTTG